MPAEHWDLRSTSMPLYDQMMKLPEYFEREKGLRWELVYMRPRDYLTQAAVIHGVPVTRERAMLEPDMVSQYAEAMRAGSRFPIPVLDWASQNQEGRHRVAAAEAIGDQQIPVLIVHKVGRNPMAKKIIYATIENMRKFEGPGVVAYSPATGEEYSATPGDYFWLPPGQCLKDTRGRKLRLGRHKPASVEGLVWRLNPLAANPWKEGYKVRMFDGEEYFYYGFANSRSGAESMANKCRTAGLRAHYIKATKTRWDVYTRPTKGMTERVMTGSFRPNPSYNRRSSMNPRKPESDKPYFNQSSIKVMKEDLETLEGVNWESMIPDEVGVRFAVEKAIRALAECIHRGIRVD